MVFSLIIAIEVEGRAQNSVSMAEDKDRAPLNSSGEDTAVPPDYNAIFNDNDRKPQFAQKTIFGEVRRLAS